jgi:hypothetical protein
MRKHMWAAVAVSLFLSVPVARAVDEHHPDQKGAPAARPATPAVGMSDEQMRKMQESMLQMHEQMHKIMQAKDPRERERLRHEHLKMMQEHMRLMHEPGGMMGGDMGRMMHGDQPMPPATPQGGK